MQHYASEAWEDVGISYILSAYLRTETHLTTEHQSCEAIFVSHRASTTASHAF